ncbi:MAG: hypothetical protein WAK93_21705, partial [Solirubrobacteraceae bacterium]
MMRVFGGLARGGSALARRRAALLVVLAVAGLSLLAAAQAPASRIQVKGAAPDSFVGHDWPGKVSLIYGQSDGKFGFFAFTFANLCSRKGSETPDSVQIRVGANKLFHYRGHGFTISGNVIGRLSDPREIAGLASVSARGCQSGPWWFGVKP